MDTCAMANNTNHPTNPAKHINITSGLTLLLVYVLVLSLNVLIIFVIFGVKHKSLRWSLDYLVSFLAITDLISTLVGVPIPIIAYFQGYWPGGCSAGAAKPFSTFNVSCKVFYLFLTWGRLSTMFIITIMCMERFLAITRPFVHRELITAGRIRKSVYAVWTVMFIYSVLPLVNIGHVSLHWNKQLDLDGDNSNSEPSYFFCFLEYDNSDTNTKYGISNLIYSVIFVLFGFLSLTIVLICVFFICRILLGRKPQINKIKIHQETTSKSYSVNGSKSLSSPISKKESAVSKSSIFARSKTFLSKRRPSIKNYESEELQFVGLMLMIAGVFYITFLPIMLLVITHIAGVGFGDLYTFWSMRFTSFVVVANPVIYGCSNKLYRVGCIYVFKSMFNRFFCCKTTPVPEKLGHHKRGRSSTLVTSCRVRSMTPAETTAQKFIIAASPHKDRAIAKAFVGNMKRGVEGEEEDLEVVDVGNFGVLLPAEDSVVVESPKEGGEKGRGEVGIREGEGGGGNSPNSCRSVTVEHHDYASDSVNQPSFLSVQHSNALKDYSLANVTFSDLSDSRASLVSIGDDAL